MVRHNKTLTPGAGPRGQAGKLSNRTFGLLLAAPVLALVSGLYVYPLVSLGIHAVKADASFTGGSLVDGLRSAHAIEAIWFSTWEATASTALTILLALPVAVAVASVKTRLATAVNALTTAAFVLPSPVVATAFRQLFGTHTGIAAVLFAHAFFNSAIVVRLVVPVLQNVNPTTVDAARSLGATPSRALWEASKHGVVPALKNSAYLVFVFSFTSFGIVLLLLNGYPATIEVRIFEAVNSSLDLRTAAALCVLQVLALAALFPLLRSDPLAELQLTVTRARFPLSNNQRFIVSAASIPLLAIVLSAIGSLVVGALTSHTGISATNFARLAHGTGTTYVSPLNAAANSVLIATIATVLAVAIGFGGAIATLYSRVLGRMLTILTAAPVIVSGVVLGLAMFLAYNTNRLNLQEGIWLVPLAQTGIALPFTLKTISNRIHTIPHEYREAARSLGAQSFHVFYLIDLRLSRNTLASAACLGFAVAISDFAATSVVARADHPTLPMLIGNYLARNSPNISGQAMAASVALLVVTTAAAALSTAFERKAPC